MGVSGPDKGIRLLRRVIQAGYDKGHGLDMHPELMCTNRGVQHRLEASPTDFPVKPIGKSLDIHAECLKHG
jgi:hypothetical protein